jgi:two-component system, NtrC family, sensor histidine kinase PilS
MGWTKALNFPSFIDRAKATVSVEQMLRSQLLWLLLLRIVLYTLLLAISYLFPAGPLEVSLLPADIFSLLLLLVFMTTMFSAIFLLVFQGNLRNFGFVQIFLDTLFVSLLVFFSGASSSIFTSAYFFPIVAGGLILPRKGGLLAAAAATLIYGTLLLLESQGLYPIYLDGGMSISTKSSSAVLNHFAVLGLTFFLAAILSALFGSRLQKTENALSDSLKSFNSLAILHQQIFDNITTGIITITEGGQITSANNAVNKITGLQPDDLLGTPLAEVFPGIELHTENHRQTTDFIKDDGTHVRIGYAHMLIQRSPDQQTDKNPPHTIITLRDISEIEQLERQVRQTEKLAAIGMMSASIAHDFRNPLTAISGSAQVLANEFSASGTKDYSNFELAKIILRESNRLIEEISDFLKFSRPEHAKCGWFSLRSCLGEVLQVCRADPEWPKSAEIILDFPDTLDVWADENQLFTVLIYLLQNAMAFCPKGKERITIAAIESEKVGPGPETVTIAVSDNGPGIEEGRREQIFEPFYTTRPEGTGLGLAIVRQTVEEHRGSITVDRGEDGGARFTISLPLPQ